MGRILCAGLGPGDPELMSVRADRLVRGARHVAYFRKAGRAGRARTIVEGMLNPDAREILRVDVQASASPDADCRGGS